MAVRPDVVVGARMDARLRCSDWSLQLWTALADEAQRAIDWQQNNNLLIGERDF